jgi:uncharacterized protein (DUF342 family)
MSTAITEHLPVVRLPEGAAVAVLDIPPDAADEITTREALTSLVRERGVLLDHAVEAAIHALAEQHMARKNQEEHASEATSGVIARAQPAIDGRAAFIAWEATFAPDSGSANDSQSESPAANANSVDHYNCVRRHKVAAGQVLGVLHAPQDGVDGRDVCGRTIAARRGRKLALQLDESVQVEADGTIRALKEGVLSLARLRVAVVDKLEVDGAVDFSTGNIDFVGSVRVQDGVRDNFTLRATGDVEVQGMVEAADVIVGGDFQCIRGVAARSSGHLLVDGSVESAYLNGVRGRVRGSIEVDREIVGCDLVIGGDLTVARGALVGGLTIVGGAVYAAALGTEGGAKTTLRIGGLPFELARASRIAGIVKELAKQVAPLEERQFEITNRGSKATAAEKESLTELAFEIAEVRRRIRLLEEERNALLVDVGQRRTVDLRISKAIHAGVTLLVGNREVRFTKPLRGPVRIGWDESRNLQFQPSGGRVQDLSEVASVREVAA